MTTIESKTAIGNQVAEYVQFAGDVLPMLLGGGFPVQVPWVDVSSAHLKSHWDLSAEYENATSSSLHIDFVPTMALEDSDRLFLGNMMKLVYPNVLKDSDFAFSRVSSLYVSGKFVPPPPKIILSEQAYVRPPIIPSKKPVKFRPPEIEFGPNVADTLARVGDRGDDDHFDVDPATEAVALDTELAKALSALSHQLQRVEKGSAHPLTVKQKKLLATYNMLANERPQHLAAVLMGQDPYMNRVVMSLQGYSGKEERNAYLAAHYAKIMASITAQTGALKPLALRMGLQTQVITEFEVMRRVYANINKAQNQRKFREEELTVFKQTLNALSANLAYPMGEVPVKVDVDGAEVVVISDKPWKRRPHFYKSEMQMLSSGMVSKIFTEGQTNTNSLQLAEMRGNIQYVLSRGYFGTNFHGFLSRLAAVLVQAQKSAQFEKVGLGLATADEPYLWDKPSLYGKYFAHMGWSSRPDWAKTLPTDPALWHDYYKSKGLPVYVVNLTAEEGLPFTPFKKFECMAARMHYNRQVYIYCQQEGVGLKRLRAHFPHICDYVAKQKGEMYELVEPMTLEIALDPEATQAWETKNLKGIKTRTIGIPSCAAHILNSLVAPVIKSAIVDRSPEGVVQRLRSAPGNQVFSLANFQYGGGRFNSLIRRLTGEHPFEMKTDDEAYWCAHFSDNIFLCDRGKKMDLVDPQIVQISAYHPRFAELKPVLDKCLQEGRKFNIEGLRYFASGDGTKMESGTTARRARAFLSLFTKYIGYPKHVTNFMRLIAPSLVADGRLLVGDAAMLCQYMISGNPLTFTFNDFGSYVIMESLPRDATLERLLVHIWDNFGFEFGWERVVIIPELGQPLCPGSQTLDIDFLGYAVLNCDLMGAYIPILQPARQDRMLVSEKRGDRTSSEGTYNKFLCAYFLGGWERPAYSDLILKVLNETLPPPLAIDDDNLDVKIDSGLEFELRTFMDNSAMTVASLSPQVVYQFFTGSNVYSALGVRRMAISSIPKMELLLFDPNAETLYTQQGHLDAQRLLKTRLELTGLRIPVVSIGATMSKDFVSDILSSDPIKFGQIVDAVGAKRNKTSFWMQICRIVANSHPELTDKFEGREKFNQDKAKHDKVVAADTRERVKKEREARKQAHESAVAEAKQAKNQPMSANPSVLLQSEKVQKQLTLNRSKVVLHADPVFSNARDKIKYCAEMLQFVCKEFLSKVNIMGPPDAKTTFGAALVAYLGIRLSNSDKFKAIKNHLLGISAPAEYNITDCNAITLQRPIYKGTDVTSDNLARGFRGELISYIVLHGLAQVKLPETGVVYGGAVGTLTIHSFLLFLVQEARSLGVKPAGL